MSGVPTVSMVLYQDALKRIAELEAQNERLEREARNAGKDIALSEAKKRISELEAERESWGNEFNAVTIMKERVAGLEAILMRINEHVFPGSSDSIDGLKRLVRERDQYYTESKQQAESLIWLEDALRVEHERYVVAVDTGHALRNEALARQAERIAELELANNRLRKTWREDTEDLAKVRVAYRRELEKQAERVRLWKERCRRYRKERNEASGRVSFYKQSFNELQEVVNEQAECVSHLERALADATKAGTPFWKERDTMNAHVVENARLREALETCKRVRGMPHKVAHAVDEALATRQGVDEKSGVLEDNRERDGSLQDAVKQREVQSLHPGSTTVQDSDVYKSVPAKERFTVQATVTEVRKGKPMQIDEPTVQATTEEAATEAERKLGWDKPAVQDTGGQRCVCGHRGLWHEQSRRYFICESPGCKCLQFTPIVTAQACNHPPVVSSNYPGFDCERCGIGPVPAAQGTDRAGTGHPPGVDRATTGGSGNKTEPAEPDGAK